MTLPVFKREMFDFKRRNNVSVQGNWLFASPYSVTSKQRIIILILGVVALTLSSD